MSASSAARCSEVADRSPSSFPPFDVQVMRWRSVSLTVATSSARSCDSRRSNGASTAALREHLCCSAAILTTSSICSTSHILQHAGWARDTSAAMHQLGHNAQFARRCVLSGQACFSRWHRAVSGNDRAYLKYGSSA